MRKVTVMTAVAAALFASAGYAQSTNHTDEAFLKDFAKANAAEVAEGKTAKDKAQMPEVKTFAQHMIDDHSKTLTKVTSLASKNNVNVKEEPGVTQKGKNMMLEHRGAEKFDEAYIKAQVKDHEEVLQMLQKEIDQGQDASVKQLASEAKTAVQKHLDMAKQLEAKVGGSASTRTSDAR